MEKMDVQELSEAQITFIIVSRLIYLEPAIKDVADYVDQDMFEDAPYGEKNGSVVSGLSQLRSWCRDVGKQRERLEEMVQELRQDWFALFVGGGTPLAPPWESYYRETNSPLFGRRTLEVRAWYQEHGLEIEKLHKEPDDNLGLMLGFVGHLIGLEVEAIDDGDDVTAERLAEAQRSFLADHILPWLARWRFEVEENAKTDFFSGVGNLTFGLCEEYVKRLGIIYKEESGTFVFL